MARPAPEATDRALAGTRMSLDIDRSSRLPLYFQLSTQLEEAIRAGDLPAGAKLENEASLATRLGLSRLTVSHALTVLVRKGLVIRRRGVGTQVVAGSIRLDAPDHREPPDMHVAVEGGGGRVLFAHAVLAEIESASALDCEPGTSVWRLVRLQTTAGQPQAVLVDTLLADFADLSVDDVERHGLRRVLSSRDHVLCVTRVSVRSRGSTAEESRLLELDPGAPVLTVDSTSFDATGAGVVFSQHVFRSDRFAFTASMVEPDGGLAPRVGGIVSVQQCRV